MKVISTQNFIACKMAAEGDQLELFPEEPSPPPKPVAPTPPPANGITVYHGSRTEGLPSLKAFFPPYEGGLGFGVYVGLNQETAAYYGKYVYKLKTKFDWDKVFRLDMNNLGEIWNVIDGLEGYSILQGESVQPFRFNLNGQWYAVTNGLEFDDGQYVRDNEIEIDLDDIGGEVHGAGYSAVYVEGIRAHASVNEEMLVFNQNDLIMVGDEQ